jgi:spore germination protein
MRFTRKSLILLLLANVLLLQTGCWDQKIYEKIGFILQIGMEFDKNGELRYTAGIPLISPEARERYEVLTTTVNRMREGRDKVRLVSGKAVEGGKTQQVFFSEELASKGIGEFLEIFLRSPENSLLANVIVVEGSPYELMKFSQEFVDKPRPTFYVNALLDNARKNSYVPETRISQFSILTHSRTIDPVVPLVSYNRKEIQIAGAALFSGDKMVGKINIKDMGLLNGLMGEKRNINYTYQGPYSSKPQGKLRSGVSILMKPKKPKIVVTIDDGNPEIKIKLDFIGSLSEYSGELNLDNQEDKKKLEEDISESIQDKCIGLLKSLAEMESDPIGFGEIVRTKHNGYWKSIIWKDVYKYAAFKVEAGIKLEFYGAMTNP